LEPILPTLQTGLKQSLPFGSVSKSRRFTEDGGSVGRCSLFWHMFEVNEVRPDRQQLGSLKVGGVIEKAAVTQHLEGGGAEHPKSDKIVHRPQCRLAHFDLVAVSVMAGYQADRACAGLIETRQDIVQQHPHRLRSDLQ
jgi:hypothetical protein